MTTTKEYPDNHLCKSKYTMRTRSDFEKLVPECDPIARDFTIRIALQIEEKLHKERTSRTYHHYNPYYSTIKFTISAIPLTYDESEFIKKTLKNIFFKDLDQPEFDLTKCLFRNRYKVDNTRYDYM